MTARVVLIGYPIFRQTRTITSASTPKKPTAYCPILIHKSPIAESLPAWALLIYPFLMIGATWFPAFPFARVEMLYAGAGVLVTACLLFLVSCWTLDSAWRMGIDPNATTGLVTRGIYARIRHPIYSALILFFVGCFLAYPCVVSAIGLALVVPGVYVQSRREERFLLERFPEYRGRTGRFF